MVFTEFSVMPPDTLMSRRRPSATRHDIKWTTSSSCGDQPGQKRVTFSWELNVQEFDIRSPPHACNPNPYLPLVDTESTDGRGVQHFTFDFEQIESTQELQHEKPPLFFEFETVDPEWVDQGGGVRSRHLFVRHDVESNGIEGVFFVENRAPCFEFGAAHKAFIRCSTDGWATSRDINTCTKSLAAFDALHRYYIPVPEGLRSGASIEYAICYRIGEREYWDNNHGRNYTAKVGWHA